MKGSIFSRITLVGLAAVLVGVLGLAILAPVFNPATGRAPAVFAQETKDTSSSKDDSSSTKPTGHTTKEVSTPIPLGNVDPATVIGRIIKGFVGAVGAVALIMFLYAGFTMMAAGGNAQRFNKGKQTMIWATIGLIGVFLSYAAVSAVLSALGA